MKDKIGRPYKLAIIISFFVFIISGCVTYKILSNTSNVVLAVNVTKTLDLIEENNPIKQIVDAEIKKIEEEKSRLEAEKKRIAEERRIEEERKIAEEKRMEEEKAKEEEIKRLQAEKEKNQKIAYLTFDDGPSKKVTPLILDILNDYDIKATFFVLGKMAVENPDILTRIYEEGHSIGHHSYSHNYNYIYKNTENFMKEIKITEQVFKDVLGDEFNTSLLRLPGGAFENYKDKYVKAAAEAGYYNYNWNALNGDAEGLDLSKERLINRLKSTIKDRKEVIILMHDTDTKMTTVETLPEIIEYLLDLGYIFKPLEQETVKEVITYE